jgi:DNA-binding beta-propeller fold protein YncE
MILALVFSLFSLAETLDPIRHCNNPQAEAELLQGMALQAELETENAAQKYQNCIKIEKSCAACHYELGWSHWKSGRWELVISEWELAQKLAPQHPDIPQYLPTAKENLALVKTKKIPKSFQSRVELATHSLPKDGPLSLFFLSRRQSYNREPDHPLDMYDADIHSPKSVRISGDGKRVYVNSLEAGKTIIYSPLGAEKIGVIKHRFTEKDKSIFDAKIPWGYRFPKEVKTPNEFLGKPVELETSHNGRFLWIPYYRRSFDSNSAYPSALSLYDTVMEKIVRVFHVGPISKYVRASPKQRWLAVSHWGDNTVGLIDIRGDNMEAFQPEALLEVEKILDTKKIKGDRDKNCGFCVRGLAFSSDEKYLFVSRMSGGGIAAFQLDQQGKNHKYLGSIFGIVPGPRDLEVSKAGYLYVSCNSSGHVARVPLSALLGAFNGLDPALSPEKKNLSAKALKLPIEKTYVGLGARSIRINSKENYLFVAVNQTSELVGVDTNTMQISARIPVDSYPVGLDLGPNDNEAWVTSQGREAKGGNSVGIFQVRYKTEEVVPGKR